MCTHIANFFFDTKKYLIWQLGYSWKFTVFVHYPNMSSRWILQCRQSSDFKASLIIFRMTVEKRGNITYCHIVDTTFDINEYLLEQKTQLKNWRDVYWRLWGTINFLSCTRCKEVFPCSEFGHCKFHPEPPRFDNDTGLYSCIGTFPCCHLKTLPIRSNTAE